MGVAAIVCKSVWVLLREFFGVNGCCRESCRSVWVLPREVVGLYGCCRQRLEVCMGIAAIVSRSIWEFPT